MPRIAGINIPEQKRIIIALTYIRGIGRATADKILKETKIDPNKKSGQLSADDVNKLRTLVEKQYKVEGELVRQMQFNIKRLKDIGSYRGIRHSKNLPVRGQRTKTNSRTRRGNVRKTAASGRKTAPAPK